VPASLTLTGTTADLPSGGSARAITATVRDALGQPMAGQAVIFSAVGGSGSVTGLGAATTGGSGGATVEVVGDRAGAVTIEARTAGLSGTLALNVVAGALDHITLTPSSVSVFPDQPQTFVTDAEDAAANLIGDESATAILQISADGICVGATCTAPQRGFYTVTSTYSGLVATATMRVRHHN
jgi:hypothetical protein